MTAVRPLAPICTLLTGAGCSFALGCGSGDGLIAPSRASDIDHHLEQLQSAVDDGRCSVAAAAIRQVRTDVRALPGSVDADLRREITAGYRKLAQTYSGACTQNRPAISQPQVVAPAAAPQPQPATKPHPRKRPHGPKAHGKKNKLGKPGRDRGHTRQRATEYGQ